MTTTARYTERDRLLDMIVEAELQHRAAVREWERQAEPIRLRIIRAEEWANASGEYKALYVARADLRALGPCPVEPLRLGMLRGRLERLREADSVPLRTA